MKTYREFLSENAVKAQQAWQAWMKANAHEFSKGGRFYEKGSSEKTTAAAKEFMKSYMKTGKPPAGFEVKSTKVPGQEVRSGSQTRTQTPPKQPSSSRNPEASWDWKTDKGPSNYYRPEGQPGRSAPKSSRTNAQRQETDVPPNRNQTPPKGAQTSTPPPPKAEPKAPQTPPKGAQTSTQTPPKQPSTSTSTQTSTGRKPNPYRATGTGRTERIRDLVNQGKGPGVGQTLKNNLRNAPNAIRNTNITKGLKTGAGLSAAISAADEKSKGSGWLRSLAKGATVAAGTALGGLGGAAAGTAVAPGAGTAIGGFAGQAAGAELAGRAFDTAAGANAAQRASMRQATRQKQAGGGLKGIGGQTTVSQTKPGGPAFMSTGSGSQRKTVQLGKTSVVKDPKTGKLDTGYLAFKTDPKTGKKQATYKRAADPSTLAQTSSNPLERIGRSIAPGAYKAQDEKARQQRLKQAAASDIKRQQALGVKGSKNLVGPKIVGTKLVGPKKVGPKVVGPKK